MSKVQSVLFSKNKWSGLEAIKWLKKHKFKVKKIDITDKFFRFRQFKPNKKKRKRTMKLNNGILFIIEFP